MKFQKQNYVILIRAKWIEDIVCVLLELSETLDSMSYKICLCYNNSQNTLSPS